MADYKKYQSDGVSAEDKALDKFAELMIEKIESLKNSDSWKQPWFTEGSLRWPRNLSGREYNGMNALLLMMLCEKQNYKLPVFCTFNRAVGLNYTTDKQRSPSPMLMANLYQEWASTKGRRVFPSCSPPSLLLIKTPRRRLTTRTIRDSAMTKRPSTTYIRSLTCTKSSMSIKPT